MDQETTRSLSKRLQSINDDDSGERFIKQHAGKRDLHIILNELLAKKEMTISDLISRSGINRNYIYNILNGERRNPGRDKIIAICIGLEAGFGNTNKALEAAKLSPLYPKDERDARIAIAINKGVRNVTDVNLMLERSGLKPLDV